MEKYYVIILERSDSNGHSLRFRKCQLKKKKGGL